MGVQAGMILRRLVNVRRPYRLLFHAPQVLNRIYNHSRAGCD